MDKTKLLNDIVEVLSTHETRFSGITFELEGNRIRISDDDEDIFLYWKTEPHKDEFETYAPTIARMQFNNAPQSLIRKVKGFLVKQNVQTTLDF